MMNFWNSIRNKRGNETVSFLSNEDLDVFDMYAKLESLYKNNGAYNNVQRNSYYYSKWVESIKPLRTVVNRSVEFYVSKILSGSRVSTEDATLLEAVNQINKWGNFASKQKTYSRSLALLGDLFIKVKNDESKVWHEQIKSKHVTDFDVDNRGILQEIRIDVPIEINEKEYIHTEFWTLDGSYVSVWEHQQGKDAELKNLGEPKEYYSLAELGVTFIPIVYVPFRDDAERGEGCVSHALDKIDEANRMVTRLHSLLFRFNKPITAIMANAVDGNGKPLPPPRIAGKNTTTTDKTDDVEKGDNDLLYLPGYSKAEYLIPNINYGDALKILQDMMNELEKDLPELRTYSLDASGNISSVALNLILGSAVDRAKEARGNIIQGLIRIIQMCLTVGIYHGIIPSAIGSYDNGDFDFSILCDEMFTMSSSERALLLSQLTNTGIPLKVAMRIAEYDEKDIEEAISEQQSNESRQNENLANSLLKFNKQ